MLDSAAEHPCLIAETAHAAAVVTDLIGTDLPRILLEDPSWKDLLRAQGGGTALLAIDDGHHLTELIAVADSLRAFDRVEVHFVGEVDSALEADIVALYAIRAVTETRGKVRFAERRRPGSQTPRTADSGGGRLLDGMLSGLRVAFTSRQTLRRLGGAVDAVSVYRATERPLTEQVSGWLNVMVVDATSESSSEGDLWAAAIEEARSMGARVVAVIDDESSRPQWADLDLAMSSLAARCVRSDFTPIGYRRVVGGRLAVVGSLVGGGEGVEDLLGLLGGLAISPGVDLFGSVHGVRLPAGMSVFPGGLDPGLVESLRPYGGVLDHPGLHETTTGRAETLMTLATAGVPIVSSQVDHRLQQLIGEEMAHLLSSAQITDLTDPEARDRLSVRLRRIALHGSQTSTWRDLAASLGMTVAPLPTISILLASNRPDFLDHALGQVRAQTYPETELVLILHGEGFSITDNQIQEKYHRPLEILRIPSTTVYGEALNRGTAASTGTLIAKMDDDDWYSKHHLWDLVHAMNYSNADLVGKGAEFVYISELAITIRRMSQGSETYHNRNIGGGTFLIRRPALWQIGGWRRLPRHVDQALLDDMESLAKHWYRTHGHGYLLHRRPGGHTWDPGLDYFLDISERQYRGLDLERSLVAD